MMSEKERDKNRMRRNGKRLLAVCLMLTMLAGLLAGCGNGSAASSTREAKTAAEDGTGKTDTLTDAGKQANNDLCCQVKTPYVADPIIESAVVEVGARYLEGSLALEETVNNIIAKIEIYMAE